MAANDFYRHLDAARDALISELAERVRADVPAAVAITARDATQDDDDLPVIELDTVELADGRMLAIDSFGEVEDPGDPTRDVLGDEFDDAPLAGLAADVRGMLTRYANHLGFPGRIELPAVEPSEGGDISSTQPYDGAITVGPLPGVTLQLDELVDRLGYWELEAMRQAYFGGDIDEETLDAAARHDPDFLYGTLVQMPDDVLASQTLGGEGFTEDEAVAAVDVVRDALETELIRRGATPVGDPFRTADVAAVCACGTEARWNVEDEAAGLACDGCGRALDSQRTLFAVTDADGELVLRIVADDLHAAVDIAVEVDDALSAGATVRGPDGTSVTLDVYTLGELRSTGGTARDLLTVDEAGHGTPAHVAPVGNKRSRAAKALRVLDPTLAKRKSYTVVDEGRFDLVDTGVCAVARRIVAAYTVDEPVRAVDVAPLLAVRDRLVWAGDGALVAKGSVQYMDVDETDWSGAWATDNPYGEGQRDIVPTGLSAFCSDPLRIADALIRLADTPYDGER